METKPAFKTLQFWLTVVLTAIGLTLTSGAVVDEQWSQLAGVVVTLAGALGGRGWVMPKTDDTEEV